MNHQRSIQITLSTMVMVMSLVVLLGWLIGSQLVVQLHPDFHPMQFNTALGFLFTALAFRFLIAKRRGVAEVFAYALLVLYTLTLVQYIFGVNFRIDTLIVDPFVLEEGAAPGRPGANTTVCFLLMGAGILLVASKIRNRGLWVGLIASVVFGVSISSLWGYATGAVGLAGWASYLSGMAVHTSVGFVLCSLLLYTMQLLDHKPEEGWYRGIRPIHAALPLLIVSLTVWNAMNHWDNERIRNRLLENAEHSATSINLTMRERHQVFERMALNTGSVKDLVEHRWIRNAGTFIENINDLHAVRLYAEGQGINWVSSDWGTRIFESIDARHRFLAQENLSRFFIIGDQPIVLIRVPLTKIDGELDAALSLDELVLETGLHARDDLSLVVEHKGKVVYESNTSDELVDRASVAVPLDLLLASDDFSLRLVPTRAYLAQASSPWPTVMLFAGFFAAAIVWFIIRQTLQLLDARNTLHATAESLSVKSDQLVASNAELLQLNRDIERFAYAISHDLKSPLFSVQGYLSLIRCNLKDGQLKELEHYLEQALGGTSRMTESVNSILSMSRLSQQIGDHQDVNLAEVIDDVLTDLNGDIRVSGAQIEVDDELHRVVGDRFFLHQVLQNLISNATKYARVDGRELMIRVGTILDEGRVCLSVEDNGRGIAPQQRERVFDMFHRLGSDEDGTGIGLNIVSRVAMMHGGKAWVDTSSMGGARFCITLPLASTPPAPDSGTDSSRLAG